VAVNLASASGDASQRKGSPQEDGRRIVRLCTTWQPTWRPQGIATTLHYATWSPVLTPRKTLYF